MAPTPQDDLALRNILSRYCEALDTKNFPLLDKVFVADVQANYPFNPDMKGVDTIRNAIINRLGPIRTHHSLTTQIITISSDGKTASTHTHFIGAHLGQGPHEGKVLSAYGRYVDELVCLEAKDGDYEGVPGASGIWRIKKRTVLFTGRVGDEMIMKEF
ncbi:SnoaL-like domain-domain-containing protein [Clohesyomyces aquaticus]|uniref:SnoaL-like domain-domain-containing protein n=1 Tax=Clohesyomyces aquaticus TaxID=1231657 RepID=A0A1Y1ZLS3_9PLEO|nr:SnoaL-like domain-domain-containing protein [Clohesyomyces aquaticus]